MDTALVYNLLIVLAAGFVAGLVCKRLKLSLVIGYLLVGMLLGEGALGWVRGQGQGLETLAEGGVLLLLFSIGLEFSLDELGRLARYLAVGGAVQMALVIVPVTLFSTALGMAWKPAVLIGSAVALSSTVLVFKALTEWGQVDSPHGRRAIGILLFQDVALVPLLLAVPFLTGAKAAGWREYAVLACSTAAFIAGVVLLQQALERWIVPLLARLRSPELVVLFVVTVLGGMCWAAHAIGLPVALGAFAAGLAFSGNRLTAQVDALVLPFRESFAAVFFVSLGLLLKPRVFWDEALLIVPGIAAVLLLKTAAAAVALRLTGLRWPAALGTGIGLAHLGEFSFVLVLEGYAKGVLTAADYQRMLCFALATLILTPQLLKLGLRWTAGEAPRERRPTPRLPTVAGTIPEVVVVGIGVAGRQAASQLELAGRDVCLVDLSPVNLHPFAQQGFRTLAGDATDEDVLRRARADQAALVVVTVPHDQVAGQIVRAVRAVNASGLILVRCRYAANVKSAKKAGANFVISEENEAAEALLKVLQRLDKSATG